MFPVSKSHLGSEIRSQGRGYEVGPVVAGSCMKVLILDRRGAPQAEKANPIGVRLCKETSEKTSRYGDAVSRWGT